jgi:hypothetical protein
MYEVKCGEYVEVNNHITNKEYIMWMGDFNHHHPMWEPQHNTHHFTTANLNATAVLINLLSLYSLIQVLPPGITTLEASNTKHLTHLDNIFCLAAMEQMINCSSIEPQLQPVITDHFLITTTIDLQPERIDSTPKPNYHNVMHKLG